MEDWYSRPAGHILKELETSPEGLSGREAARRLEREGPNELEAPRGPGLPARLLGQLFRGLLSLPPPQTPGPAAGGLYSPVS